MTIEYQMDLDAVKRAIVSRKGRVDVIIDLCTKDSIMIRTNRVVILKFDELDEIMEAMIYVRNKGVVTS